jgi:hypothetical protein
MFQSLEEVSGADYPTRAENLASEIFARVTRRERGVMSRRSSEAAEADRLGEAFVQLQAEIIGRATLNNRGEFITTLFDLGPAILRRQPPPQSQAIEFAFTFRHPS